MTARQHVDDGLKIRASVCGAIVSHEVTHSGPLCGRRAPSVPSFVNPCAHFWTPGRVGVQRPGAGSGDEETSSG